MVGSSRLLFEASPKRSAVGAATAFGSGRPFCAVLLKYIGGLGRSRRPARNGSSVRGRPTPSPWVAGFTAAP
jgi:hypothetical protein